jgi:hypothetical protein
MSAWASAVLTKIERLSFEMSMPERLSAARRDCPYFALRILCVKTPIGDSLALWRPVGLHRIAFKKMRDSPVWALIIQRRLRAWALLELSTDFEGCLFAVLPGDKQLSDFRR